ncbi:hypothetical protein ACFWXT_29580, partial [Bacillus cereus]|uniref:hypothetical protein n=1 Tax=Bacillus cereus TaxID=1396 RepID=UPI00366F2F16
SVPVPLKDLAQEATGGRATNLQNPHVGLRPNPKHIDPLGSSFRVSDVGVTFRLKIRERFTSVRLTLIPTPHHGQNLRPDC